jgi:phosphohistidine phosphatase
MRFMHLFVIRHALAEEQGSGQPDSERALTPEGIKKLKKIVQGMREVGVDFERVLTSPWTRAVQTAELLAPLCDEPPIVTSLLAQAPRAELLAQIAELAEDTAIVGHEPWLSELVAWLAFGDTRHGDALELKKASLVWLEGSAVPGGMTVRAMLPPKILRVVARNRD